MMGFVAYAQNLNETVKLLTMSKVVQLTSSCTEKNRIFVTGSAMMSTKLSASKQAIDNAIQDLLQHPPISVPFLKRCQLLEKHDRIAIGYKNHNSFVNTISIQTPKQNESRMHMHGTPGNNASYGTNY